MEYKYEFENVLYFDCFNEIGGVESWMYYLSRLYKNFVVFYRSEESDMKQIDRLSERVAVHRWKGERIKCKRIFLNYHPSIIDAVDAEEYIGVVHRTYKGTGDRPNVHHKITKWIGVSKEACQDFEELTGKKCELMYNPIVLDPPKKVLRLISATRLTNEKGRAEMEKLGRCLNNAGIPYIWLIFTDDWNRIDNENIIYMNPKLDITNYIADSDYLVQLSERESFCYSVVEALKLGVPCIVRDLPIWKEIGLKDGENGFIFDFYMQDIDVNKIYKGLGKFKYEEPKSDWGKYLKDESDYDPNRMVKVRARSTYDDVALGRRVIKGEEFEVTEKRKNYLTDRDLVDIIELP